METKIEHQKSYVEKLRSIRDKIDLEIQDMDFEQLKEYLNQRERLFPESYWNKAKKQQREPE